MKFSFQFPINEALFIRNNNKKIPNYRGLNITNSSKVRIIQLHKICTINFDVKVGFSSLAGVLKKI